jgi:hypothetical protein
MPFAASRLPPAPVEPLLNPRTTANQQRKAATKRGMTQKIRRPEKIPDLVTFPSVSFPDRARNPNPPVAWLLPSR